MKKLYVYSTLTGDQVYTNHRTDANGVPQAVSSVFIAGGANLMSKHFVTPMGMATEVTAEQLAELRNNEMFKLHEKNGFIRVSEAREDADKVASDMTGRDKSAPLVEQDLAEDEPEVTTNKPETKRGPGRPRRS